MSDLGGAVFGSRLGWLGLAWRGETLVAIVFGQPTEESARKALGRSVNESQTVMALADDLRGPLPAPMADVARRLLAYADGAPDDFRDIELDRGNYSEFQWRVIEACRSIPYGGTRSYGQLAVAAGSPRAARAVGTVMRTNRYPLLVPCHRVLASDGSLGGYSAPDGLLMKKRLLALESRSAAAASLPAAADRAVRLLGGNSLRSAR
jgi:methylated-DNA-[protein]-cysteine S-methyltransferase